MPFALRRMPELLRAEFRGLSEGRREERPPADDAEPTTGVHRIGSLLASPEPSEADDVARLEGLIDAHRTRVEALRCELALATRFLEAVAAGDVARADALELESEHAAPARTCPPLDLGCLSATSTDPAAADDDEDAVDFPEVRAAEARLRAALRGPAV